MILFLATLTAFFFGFLVTPIIIFFFRKNNVLDAPGGRKIHKGMTPSMGGISIMLATFIGLATWLSFDQMATTRYFLIAMGIMFTLGLRDDLVELTALQKLIGQCIAAFLVIGMADIRVTSFYGFLGVYEIPLAVSYFLTFFTIIVLTNAFNLIDGLDGLAGTISTITLTFLGWWFITAGMLPYGIIAFTMVGAILSFLLYNWHPAKIFMGDTGSLSIGFVLSVLVILFIDKNGTMLGAEGFKYSAPIASGVALLIVPIYDTARIFTKRVLNGKSPLAPDKSHVHHFLLRMGLGHDQVAYVLGTVKLLFIGLIFLGQSYNDHVMLPIVVLSAVTLGLVLDRYTLIQIIKINKTKPTVLSTRITKKAYKKPALSKEVLDREKLNMN
ncbi:glycosyltransferase family 4 protein [Litoribacter populi]|uniref:glycosyltransferase family 4 protein n=1 Tax=Litoribacter populi TaxID=2598460 RepID=UPI001180FD5E|nr:MraY family glycosyltransferase [Litoribacter populi]